MSHCSDSSDCRLSKHGRGREHSLVVLFGEVAESRGLVDRIPDHGVLVALFSADVSGDDGTHRDADTGLELADVVAKLSVELAGGAQRAAGGVVHHERRPEDRQRGVAFELVDRSSGLFDDVDDVGEESIEQDDDVLRVMV